MRVLKVIAIILIWCSCCGLAFPTDSLTGIIEKYRVQIPQYKETLLNSTFLPILKFCDKTETAKILCNNYLEMVAILSKTPNLTLFETQEDVKERLNQLPKSLNSSDVFQTFCTKFHENYPNNTLSDQFYCIKSCSDITETSGINKMCALIYIGYAERNISTQLATVVNIPKSKEEGKSLGLQNGNVNEIPIHAPIVNAIAINEKVTKSNEAENQQNSAQDSNKPGSVNIPAPAVIAATPIQNVSTPISTPLQRIETAKTIEAIAKPLLDVVIPMPALVSKDLVPPKTSEPKAIIPPELPKSVPQSEDEPDNHEDEEINETGTETSPDYPGRDDNEELENINVDQESNPVFRNEKPQKLEANPLNPKDTVIIKTAVADDPYSDNSDSNFFAYFMFLMFVCVVCYVGYHNKSKVMALLLEGRRTSGGRNGIGRRKHTAAYRKLDTNLEEAISSNSSGRTTQIIY